MTARPFAAVLIDTMVASSLANQERQPEVAGAYRFLVGRRTPMVSFVTVTELRYGAAKAQWGDRRRRDLERELADFPVVHPDDELMSICADLRAECERAGHPLAQKIHDSDRWVAATAIRLDAELISDDSVFEAVPGLYVRSLRS